MLCHINLGQNSRSTLRVILENVGESTLIQSQISFNVVIFSFFLTLKSAAQKYNFLRSIFSNDTTVFLQKGQ